MQGGLRLEPIDLCQRVAKILAMRGWAEGSGRRVRASTP